MAVSHLMPWHRPAAVRLPADPCIEGHEPAHEHRWEAWGTSTCRHGSRPGRRPEGASARIQTHVLPATIQRNPEDLASNTSVGPAADCGWIAYGVDCIGGLEGRPSYPSGGRRGLLQGEWNNNRHLWASYVPEVFGIQILTAAHLDRARDLRDWKISSFGNDRYLVEAADLEKWYSQPTPYISARGFAHHDFGDMILTETAICADPHGWLSGDGARHPVDL